MPKQGQTTDQARRAARQESHREWLSEKCTLQHFVDNLEKIEGLDATSEAFTNELAKYKTANEQRLKIMNKSLPDLKSTEITGDAGGAITIKIADYSGQL